ncbi:uncharacterized protein EI90DRAFT_1517933 [Cantharellus anzutake]|uniref:uncharacterized protein n=1 Tax=Cantharellus anzutake TaxID=1750568 RepID=UPI001905F215|nr:uncharacterized protein EI90DRAFT_1517933 [Cantharellus anzutake]KAF8328710.1 hypothetical protein EI90DRAFT_1517933 [Cantharellus anzutake]
MPLLAGNLASGMCSRYLVGMCYLIAYIIPRARRFVPYALPSYLVSSPFTSSHFPAPCPRILLPRRRAPERSAVDITSFRVNRATIHRRCNRDWNNDAKCSNCDTLGTPCLRRERNSGSHESGSRNQDNTAGTSTRSEVHSAIRIVVLGSNNILPNMIPHRKYPKASPK